MRPAPIAWPACDVPPPRIVIGQPVPAAGLHDADEVLAGLDDHDARPARSGRRWRRSSRARARRRRSGLRLRSVSRSRRSASTCERCGIGACGRHGQGHRVNRVIRQLRRRNSAVTPTLTCANYRIDDDVVTSRMPSGRHFLQIPGPTNTPDRVLRAMAQPTIDHRGPEFAALGREVLDGLKRSSRRRHRW